MNKNLIAVSTSTFKVIRPLEKTNDFPHVGLVYTCYDSDFMFIFPKYDLFVIYLKLLFEAGKEEDIIDMFKRLIEEDGLDFTRFEESITKEEMDIIDNISIKDYVRAIKQNFEDFTE